MPASSRRHYSVRHRVRAAVLVACLAGPLAAGCSNGSPSAAPTTSTGTLATTGTAATSPASSLPTDSSSGADASTSPSTPSTPASPSTLSSADPSGSATGPVSATSPGAGTPTPTSPGTGSAGPTPTDPTTPTGPTTPSAPPPGSPTPAAPPSKPTPPGKPQLDGENALVVAYYGTGGTDVLGVMGRGTPQQAWKSVTARAKAYDRPGLPAVPAFEFIATVAAAQPGRGGLYRNRVPDETIAKYVQVARANGGMIFLDIQPGRADFLTEAKALQKWLEQPEVGLALDPEWHMGPNQIPAKTIGSVDASEVNQVGAWLESLVVSKHLPNKLFVVHKFTDSMIRHEERLGDWPHLREVINIDGFGKRSLKLDKYHRFAKGSPWPLGLKLFTKKVNDPDLLQPAEVLTIKPKPVIVNYQ